MKHPSEYGPEDFSHDTGVSRETLDRLKAYAEILVAWNKKVNLIGRSTVGELWFRHMLDSAQLYPLVPRNTQTLLDIGSGAGFPGFVLAIMGISGVHLVESDKKKAAFLREAARLTGAAVEIHTERVEDMTPFPADLITARAVASLEKLLSWSAPFLKPDTLCLFLKGRNVEVELTEAHHMWESNVSRRPSRTDPEATVVCMREVRRVQSHRS